MNRRVSSCAFSFLLVHLVAYIVPCNSIKCRKTIFDQEHVTYLDGECSGDTCLTFIDKAKNGGQRNFGCLTGYDVKPGCKNDTSGAMAATCFCKDRDFCNGNATDVEIVQPATIQCYSGKVVDGKVEGNHTCTGQTCLFSLEPGEKGKPSEVVASCGDGNFQSYHFFSGKGCMLFNSPSGSSGDQFGCRCSTNLCNSPSSFDLNKKRSSKVKCLLNEVVVENGTLVTVHDSTCHGDFCVFQPVQDASPAKILRGCASFSNGAVVKPKLYKLEIQSELETYFCNEDNCNKDLVTVIASIHKTL